jgi:hypothetical protein
VTPHSVAGVCGSVYQAKIWVTTAAFTTSTRKVMKVISIQVGSALTRLHN